MKRKPTNGPPHSAVLRRTHKTDSQSVKIKCFDDRSKFKFCVQSRFRHIWFLSGIRDCGVCMQFVWCVDSTKSVMGLMIYITLSRARTAHDADCKCYSSPINRIKIREKFPLMRSVRSWPKSSGHCSTSVQQPVEWQTLSVRHLARIELCARMHQDLLTSNS